MTKNPPVPRVSLVIGSGSVKCAAAIGVVKALTAGGIGIERVVGCSAGAIFGALIALGYSMDNAREATTRLWTAELTARRNTRALLAAIAPRLFGFDVERFGLRDDRLINERLQQAFGDRQIEDSPIPLHIVAADFSNGELVDLNRGSLAKAIRASVALPFAFPPVRWGDKLLADGCLADPLPVSVAIRHGARVIVAVGFESPYQEHIRSPGRFAFQLSAIMSNNLLKSRFSFHSVSHHSEVIAIIPEFKQRVRLFDTEKVPYIIDEGERAAAEQMPYLRELLAAEAPDAAGATA
ncbi:patatin-like phospholipase family protein [Ramlibacter rhizophilus]|uniref:Patatin-like phospholipase family protein n=1 Tax=Ramlibacter rhizophilus TaxID=1781167 RepID=A0A4Z0BEB7_9BURK|nr:patatin-like phospholipase family protein [Ramlibacter rhizophilus]TFY96454.1 patatin-like phospholipase family protein [Ramlibacter rhizophilus]